MNNFSKGLEYTEVRSFLEQNFKKGCYEVLPQIVYPTPSTTGGKKTVQKNVAKKQPLYITPPLLCLRETNMASDSQPPPEKRQVPKDPSKILPAISATDHSCLLNKDSIGIAQGNQQAPDKGQTQETLHLLDIPEWSEEDLSALEEIEKHNKVTNGQKDETGSSISETGKPKHDSDNISSELQSSKVVVNSSDNECSKKYETFTNQMLSWKLEAAESLLERLNSRLLRSTLVEEVVKLRDEIEDVTRNIM
ncbi:ATP-dependent DNA helicase Q-like 4A [Galdieria sulphuraria]|nr:ATP-dependent DNA helicase Q-like 4A [Galdieria sulphuraria]